MALVILTILGLAVALVTQSELQVGGNERIVTRVFYAAESGIAVSTARMLVQNDCNAHTVLIPDTVAGSPLVTDNLVYTSPFIEIQRQPCDLCGINGAGQYGAKDYYTIYRNGLSNAGRFDAQDHIIGEKTLSVMVGLTPALPPSGACQEINNHSNGAARGLGNQANSGVVRSLHDKLVQIRADHAY